MCFGLRRMWMDEVGVMVVAFHLAPTQGWWVMRGVCFLCDPPPLGAWRGLCGGGGSAWLRWLRKSPMSVKIVGV